jgi:aminoglycoside phosphotransferase (APT) family kinase protein
VVVRLAGGRNTCAVDMWAYRQFELMDVPAPRVLAHNAHPPRIGYPTIVMTKRPGQWLNAGGVSAEAEQTIYRQLGKTVRSMHGLEMSGFGRLIAMNEQVAGEHDTWQAYLSGRPRERVVRYLRGHSLITATDEEALIGGLSRLDEVRLGQAVFVHGDLHRRNLLFDEGCLAGIIDVESGLAGDRRLDIAVASLWQTSHQRLAFEEGNGCLASDPAVAFYRAWVAARKLVWRHQTGSAVGAKNARQALLMALQEL